MATEVAPDQMQVQARIQAARQEAENLKTKIKRRKDELADTSRGSLDHPPALPHAPDRG